MKNKNKVIALLLTVASVINCVPINTNGAQLITEELSVPNSKAVTYSANRSYRNEESIYINLTEEDLNGKIGRTSDYFILSDDGQTITVKPITFTNTSDQPWRVWFFPYINYQECDANGIVRIKNSENLMGYKVFEVPAGGTTTLDFTSKLVSLKGNTDLQGNKMRFLLDGKETIRINMSQGNADYMTTGIENLTITNNYTISAKPYYKQATHLGLFAENNIYNAIEGSGAHSGATGRYGTWYLKNQTTGDEYTWTGSGNKTISDAKLGTYYWKYTSSDPTAPYGYKNYINQPTIEGTFNKVIGYDEGRSLYRAFNNQYTYVEAEIFFDFNKDGVRQVNEPLVPNNSTEKSKISLTPFSGNKTTEDIFYDKSKFKVWKTGSLVASYTGTMYKTVPVVKGVNITAADISNFRTVKIPAPVFVYMKPNINIKYKAGNQVKEGNLKLTNKSNSSQTVTLTINSSGNAISIPQLDSGDYTYTFTPSDTSLQTVTGNVTLAPDTETPDANGYISKTFNIEMDTVTTAVIQPFYDSNYNTSFDTGEQLLNKVTKIGSLSTVNNIATFTNTGVYNVDSILGLEDKDYILNYPSIEVDNTKLIKKDNLGTHYIAVAPPISVKGELKDEKGEPISNVAIKVNNKHSTLTDALGFYAFNIGYIDFN